MTQLQFSLCEVTSISTKREQMFGMSSVRRPPLSWPDVSAS